MIEVKPSTRKGKKLDVYFEGKFIKSIGQAGAMDYHQYLEINKELADRKRLNYFRRHQKGIEAGHLGEILAWAILWS